MGHTFPLLRAPARAAASCGRGSAHPRARFNEPLDWSYSPQVRTPRPGQRRGTVVGEIDCRDGPDTPSLSRLREPEDHVAVKCGDFRSEVSARSLAFRAGPRSPACLPAVRHRPSAAEAVAGAAQIGDLGDKPWLNPMHAREFEGRAETRRARRLGAQGGLRPRQRVKTSAQILEHLLGHTRADPAGIHKFALIRVVAEQERPEVRP